MSQQQQGQTFCGLTGCNNPCYIYPNGVSFGYCSMQHSQMANSTPTCQQCHQHPCTWNPSTQKYHNFCSKRCAKLSIQPSVIKVLPQSDPKYTQVKDQFDKKWSTNSSVKTPTVHSICKIIVSQPVESKFQTYVKSIIAKGVRPHGRGGPGNTHRRFHGTSQTCSLGKNGNTSLCNNSQCAVCNIIKTGWKISFSKAGMFGKGIYFTSTSNKSHSFNSQSEVGLGTGFRSMLVGSVCIGNGFVWQGPKTVKQPPTGFDSVLAEPGTSLVYDEVVVYDDDAAIPKYLIVYQY